MGTCLSPLQCIASGSSTELVSLVAGIDDPYEEPEAAEVVVEVAKEDGVLLPPELMAQSLIKYLTDKGFLSGPSS